MQHDTKSDLFLHMADIANAAILGYRNGALMDRMPGDPGLAPGTRSSHIDGPSPTYRHNSDGTGVIPHYQHRGHDIAVTYTGTTMNGHKLRRARITPPDGPSWMGDAIFHLPDMVRESAEGEIDRRMDEEVEDGERFGFENQ